MPIVHIHLLEGRDIEKKRLLVKRVTDAIVETLGTDPMKISITLDEMKHDNYSVAGVLHSDKQKA